MRELLLSRRLHSVKLFQRRKLMESKENRSDASTPLLRQPSAAESLMSTSSATADSGVPPTEEMDTGSAMSSSNATTNMTTSSS